MGNCLSDKASETESHNGKNRNSSMKLPHRKRTLDNSSVDHEGRKNGREQAGGAQYVVPDDQGKVTTALGTPVPHLAAGNMASEATAVVQLQCVVPHKGRENSPGSTNTRHRRQRLPSALLIPSVRNNEDSDADSMTSQLTPPTPEGACKKPPIELQLGIPGGGGGLREDDGQNTSLPMMAARSSHLDVNSQVLSPVANMPIMSSIASPNSRPGNTHATPAISQSRLVSVNSTSAVAVLTASQLISSKDRSIDSLHGSTLLELQQTQQLMTSSGNGMGALRVTSPSVVAPYQVGSTRTASFHEKLKAQRAIVQQHVQQQEQLIVDNPMMPVIRRPNRSLAGKPLNGSNNNNANNGSRGMENSMSFSVPFVGGGNQNQSGTCPLSQSRSLSGTQGVVVVGSTSRSGSIQLVRPLSASIKSTVDTWLQSQPEGVPDDIPEVECCSELEEDTHTHGELVYVRPYRRAITSEAVVTGVSDRELADEELFRDKCSDNEGTVLPAPILS